MCLSLRVRFVRGGVAGLRAEGGSVENLGELQGSAKHVSMESKREPVIRKFEPDHTFRASTALPPPRLERTRHSYTYYGLNFKTELKVSI